jgi:hypothetical protein
MKRHRQGHGVRKRKSLGFAEISSANLTWLGNPKENGSFNGPIMGNDGKITVNGEL